MQMAGWELLESGVWEVKLQGTLRYSPVGVGGPSQEAFPALSILTSGRCLSCEMS